MELNYGGEKIRLQLPEDIPWEIIESSNDRPLANPRLSIVKALRNPIASAPLHELVRPGESVCLLVNDNTRVARSELFLPLLIDELARTGVNKKDIFIVFTNGAHRSLADDEMKSLVGDSVASEIARYNHESKNGAELDYLGLTSRGTPLYINRRVAQADWRILTGSVVHHFFAGFGGGRKALFPGVAGWETIQKNHSLMLDERARGGVLTGNPVHDDLLEAAQKLDRNFLLNTVLNERKELLGVFAGDLVQAHEQACAMVDRVYGVPLKRLADVVIASCGGFPKDINLYQAHKTLDNAVSALKQGGRIILLAQCPEGFGSSVFEEWAMRYSSLVEIEAALRERFVLGGHKAYAIARLLQRGQVYLVSQIPPKQSQQLGFIPASTIDEALEAVYENERNLFTTSCLRVRYVFQDIPGWRMFRTVGVLVRFQKAIMSWNDPVVTVS